MPSKAKHLSQSILNEDFAKEIEKLDNKYSGWIVVAHFYSILHLVDAYIRNAYRYQPSDHYARKSAISRDSQLRTIYRDYRQLETESREARYKCHNFNKGELKTIHNYHATLKAYLMKIV